MKWNPIGILLLSFSLLILAGIVITTGYAPFGGINTHKTEEQITEDTSSTNTDPEGIQTIKAQALTESRAAGLKFSGEILTCTNRTDLEQVIDLRLSNLDVDDLLINIYPLGSTIELLKGQIIRKDFDLPYGISSLKLVSNSGDELILQVPPCVSRGGSSNDGSQSSLSGSTDEFDEPPAPVPELSTIALIGLGMTGLIFIICRSKQ